MNWDFNGNKFYSKIKEHPNFTPSGILSKYNHNNYKNNTLLKYTEPLDSIKPDITEQLYQLYPFENDIYYEAFNLDKSHILIGSNYKVCDLFLDEISISSQHAVIQFRNINNKTIPYIMDLDSRNGTFLNNNKIQSSRYYQLLENDNLRFSNSIKEFIVLINKNN